MNHIKFSTVAEAIAESAANNSVTRVVSTPATRAELLNLCDDSAESDELEFWGVTDDGDNWRVHCASPGNWGA